MKIALITKQFLPERGGAERYSAYLATTLSAMGHEIHLFATAFADNIPAGLHSHLLPIAKNTQRDVFRQRVHEIVERVNCDVIYAITHHYPADLHRAGDGVYRHWLSVKHPYWLARKISQMVPKRRAHYLLERQIYTPGNCKGIIANSKLVKDHIAQYYSYPRDRIYVVYNGVDHQKFCPRGSNVSYRQKLAIGNKLLLLFVANNWKRKGLVTVLRGARKLIQQRRAMLVVVGRGKPARWKHLCKHLAISEGVIFSGVQSDIGNYYRAADVMVLPTWYDPFANVCLEAMACGTPVITSRENGAAEIIAHDKSGYILSSPHADDELATYLDALADNDLRRAMGKNALAGTLPFTVESNAQQTVEILRLLKSI